MPRVLLAEDNKINQVVAAGALKKLGYEVDIVEDGTQAVSAVADAPYGTYAVVLMDVMMPTMDGYQATGRLRQRERDMGLPPLPIIGLSARAMDGDREIALDAGMSDYLTKPLRTPVLEQALNVWTKRPTPTGASAE